MDNPQGLTELRITGRMIWTSARRAWAARPTEVIEALGHDGFEEYRREIAHGRAGHEPTGGVWQGLDRRTGAVASAIWVRRSASPEALVFIDIDGEPVEVVEG
jgi:hypothetical protein